MLRPQWSDQNTIVVLFDKSVSSKVPFEFNPLLIKSWYTVCEMIIVSNAKDFLSYEPFIDETILVSKIEVDSFQKGNSLTEVFPTFALIQVRLLTQNWSK